MAELRKTAISVAEAVGALRRLTLGPADELEKPADVADVLAGLSLAMSLMPQLLGQLAAFLEIEHVKGAVSDGQGTGGAGSVRAVSDALHQAGLDAEAMAVALDSARGACEKLETMPGGPPWVDPVTIDRVAAAE